MLNKMQEKKLNEELNKQAFENSRNNFGELSYDQINRIYKNLAGKELIK